MGSVPFSKRAPWCTAGMKPEPHIRAPFTIIEFESLITTKAGRLSFSVPSP